MCVRARSTLVLCWSQLVDNTACQWVPIALNLAVHVAMARARTHMHHTRTHEHTSLRASTRWLLSALTGFVRVCGVVRRAQYYYYALATLGRSVWWKRHLTTAQVIQFAIDVPACAAALLLRVRRTHVHTRCCMRACRAQQLACSCSC